jgi:hypothetical protein
MQVEVDKGEGQLAKPSTRCSRSQLKPNAIATPTITAQKGPTHIPNSGSTRSSTQTQEKTTSAIPSKTKRKVKVPNRNIPALSLDLCICKFLFSFLIFLLCMGFLFQF